MQKNLIELLRYIFSVLVGSFIAFGTLVGWKTKVDMRLSENEKDINNLKLAGKNYVQKEDMQEIKKTLKEIQDKLFEIAKNMPIK